jgi:predicted nucleic acid-binding protein
MGAGRVKSAVSDAGPLIHLKEIGFLLALQLFDEIHIPDAVWKEVIEHGKVKGIDNSEIGNINRHTLNTTLTDAFIKDRGLQRLHTGEIECLFLCKQINVPIILTDDLSVRDTAKHLNITPVGSLGIIVKAYRVGNISLAQAEKFMLDLYEISSLFVTKTIVELAIEELHE